VKQGVLPDEVGVPLEGAAALGPHRFLALYSGIFGANVLIPLYAEVSDGP